MNEPEVHTLAGPYVLDALPDTERTSFEQHLAGCPSCTSEVSELREATAKLAVNVSAAPPPRLKADVMAAIDQVRQLPPLVSTSDDGAASDQPGVVSAPRAGFGRRSLFALAAAFLAVAASGLVALDQYNDKTTLAQTNQRVAAILAEPDAKTVHGAVAGGGQAAVVASTRADAAVVVLKDLPKLPDDKTWQMWLIDSSQAAHSVGLADDETGDDLTRVISGGVTGKVAFGLTVEPAGGSAKPTLPTAALISMA